MDAKSVAKKVVNVALKPAEVVLDVVNKADRAIHKVTDEPMMKKIKRVGTQADHHVTSGSNHTKTVASMPANSTKPMSAEDKRARKEFGPKSWNNGYTN